jgi:hypothetical protein
VHQSHGRVLLALPEQLDGFFGVLICHRYNQV